MRAPSNIKTLAPNALRPDNSIRVCNVPGDPTSCGQMAYKDPNGNDQWKPSIPAVRFDRETGRPYDAKAAGLSLDFVINDTYRTRAEAAAAKISDIDAPETEGVWSGGRAVGRPRWNASPSAAASIRGK